MIFSTTHSDVESGLINDKSQSDEKNNISSVYALNHLLCRFLSKPSLWCSLLSGVTVHKYVSAFSSM